MIEGHGDDSYKYLHPIRSNFSSNVYNKVNLDGLADALEKLSGVAVPKAVNDIRTAPVLHDRVVDAEDMPATVKEILKIS